MNILSRVKRHTKLSLLAANHKVRQTPPFMIIFINSICNLTCEHCFYWKELNKRDDLTFAEFEKLSLELDSFENLNLSGGEPFLRKEFADICELFIVNNNVKNIYVPTNGFFTDRTEKALRQLIKNGALEMFVCEISLDGMPDYHNRFRGNPRSFKKAMETYEMLARLNEEDPRFRIHSNTVAMSENLDEIWQLTEYLHENCPKIEHHNLAIIRGDRKNPSLQGPHLQKYKELYRHVAEVWRDREQHRFGASVEPMLQWAKVKTIETESQYIPCKAGVLTGVVYANGDVSVCEQHFPLGNLRNNSFFEIWDSPDAQKLREQISARTCYCTNEIFLWSSIVFQPVQLTRAAMGSRKEKALAETAGFATT